MRLDHSSDYLLIDNTESVTWQSRRTSGDMLDTLVDYVLREAIGSREAAESGGAYVPGDCWFALPNTLLQNGPPKPGDWLIDGEQSRFVILEVNGRLRDGAGYQDWRCRGRNLVLAFDLRDTISIEEPKLSLDAAGVEVRSGWTARHAGLAAKVVELRSEAADVLGLRGFQGQYAIYLEREAEGVVNKMRIPWAAGTASARAALSGYLEVLAYIPGNSLEKLPMIDARAMP